MVLPPTRPTPFFREDPLTPDGGPRFFNLANPFLTQQLGDQWSDDYASARSNYETAAKYAQATGTPIEEEPGLLSTVLSGLDRIVSAGSGFTTGLLGADLVANDDRARPDRAGFLDLESAFERAGRGLSGEHIGWGDTAALKYDEDDSGFEKFVKGAGAFTGDVLSDPLTYISFGTSIGRGAASQLAGGAVGRQVSRELSEKASKDLFEAAGRKGLGEAAERATREEIILEGKRRIVGELDNQTILGALATGRGKRAFDYDNLADYLGDDALAKAMNNELDTYDLVRLIPEEELDRVVKATDGDAMMEQLGDNVVGSLAEMGSTGQSLVEIGANVIGEGSYRLGGARRLRSELNRVFGDKGEDLFRQMHSDVRGGARFRIPGLRQSVDGSRSFGLFGTKPRAAIPLHPGQTGGGQIIDSAFGRATGLQSAANTIEGIRRWASSTRTAEALSKLGGRHGELAVKLLGNVFRDASQEADSPAAFSRLVTQRLADEARERARRLATQSYETMVRSVPDEWRTDTDVHRAINRLATHPEDMAEIAAEEGIDDQVLKFAQELRLFYDRWGQELEDLGVIPPNRRSNYVPHLVKDEYLDTVREFRTQVGLRARGVNVGSGHGSVKNRLYDEFWSEPEKAEWLQEKGLDLFELEDPATFNQAIADFTNGRVTNVFEEDPFEVLNEYQRRMLGFASENQYRNLLHRLGIVFYDDDFDRVIGGWQRQGPEPTEGERFGGRQVFPDEPPPGLPGPERPPGLPGGPAPGIEAPWRGGPMVPPEDVRRTGLGLPPPTSAGVPDGTEVNVSRTIGPDMEPSPGLGELVTPPLTQREQMVGMPRGVNATRRLKDRLEAAKRRVRIEGQEAQLDEATRDKIHRAETVLDMLRQTKANIMDVAQGARTGVSYEDARRAVDQALEALGAPAVDSVEAIAPTSVKPRDIARSVVEEVGEGLYEEPRVALAADWIANTVSGGGTVPPEFRQRFLATLSNHGVDESEADALIDRIIGRVRGDQADVELDRVLRTEPTAEVLEWDTQALRQTADDALRTAMRARGVQDVPSEAWPTIERLYEEAAKVIEGAPGASQDRLVVLGSAMDDLLLVPDGWTSRALAHVTAPREAAAREGVQAASDDLAEQGVTSLQDVAAGRTGRAAPEPEGAEVTDIGARRPNALPEEVARGYPREILAASEQSRIVEQAARRGEIDLTYNEPTGHVVAELPGDRLIQVGPGGSVRLIEGNGPLQEVSDDELAAILRGGSDPTEAIPDDEFDALMERTSRTLEETREFGRKLDRKYGMERQADAEAEATDRAARSAPDDADEVPLRGGMPAFLFERSGAAEDAARRMMRAVEEGDEAAAVSAERDLRAWIYNEGESDQFEQWVASLRSGPDEEADDLARRIMRAHGLEDTPETRAALDYMLARHERLGDTPIGNVLPRRGATEGDVVYEVMDSQTAMDISGNLRKLREGQPPEAVFHVPEPGRVEIDYSQARATLTDSPLFEAAPDGGNITYYNVPKGLGILEVGLNKPVRTARHRTRRFSPKQLFNDMEARPVLSKPIDVAGVDHMPDGRWSTDSFALFRVPDPEEAADAAGRRRLQKWHKHLDQFEDVEGQSPRVDKLIPPEHGEELTPVGISVEAIKDRASSKAGPNPVVLLSSADNSVQVTLNGTVLRRVEEVAETVAGGLDELDDRLRIYAAPGENPQLKPVQVFLDDELIGVVMPMREAIPGTRRQKILDIAAGNPPRIAGGADIDPEAVAQAQAQEAVSLIEYAERQMMEEVDTALSRAHAAMQTEPGRPGPTGPPEFQGVTKEEFLEARARRLREGPDIVPFDYTGERVPPGGRGPRGGEPRAEADPDKLPVPSPEQEYVYDGVLEGTFDYEGRAQQDPAWEYTEGAAEARQAIEDAIIIASESPTGVTPSGRFADPLGGPQRRAPKPESWKGMRNRTRWEQIAHEAGFDPQNATVGSGRDARPAPALRDSVIWHGVLMDDFTRDALKMFGNEGRWQEIMSQVFEPYMRWFRTQATVGRGPGFVVRNVLGGLANARLVGATARDMLDGMRIARMWSKANREVAEEGLFGTALQARRLELFADKVRESFSEEAAEQILEAHHRFWQMGLADIRQMSLSELTDFTGRSRLFDQTAKEDLNPLQRVMETTAEGIPGITRPLTRKTADWTKEAEHALRFGSFMAGARRYGLEDGGYAASMLTKASQFDYGDLSSFERNVMREIIPFYTFTRKNLPLQMRGIVTDPAKFAHLQRLVEQVQEAYAPEEGSQADAYNDVLPTWFVERMGQVTGVPLGGGQLGIRAESPKLALEEWLPGSVRGAVQAPRRIKETAIGQANPLVDVAFGWATDRDPFTGQEIGSGDGASSKGDWYGRQISPLYANVRRLAPGQGTSRDESRREGAWLSTVLGVPVATIDEAAAKGALRARAADLFDEVGEGLEDLAEQLEIPEEDLRKMLREQGVEGTEAMLGVPSGTLGGG